MVFSQVGPLSPPLYLVHSFLSFRSLFKSHLFVCVGGGCLLSLHIDLVYWLWTPIYRPLPGFLDSSVGKESTCNAGDPGLIPGSGRST